jgi:hypothetical protein
MSRDGTSKVRGMTPTITNALRLSSIARPSTDGSDPKKRSHAAALTTAVFASGRSSCASSVRPMSGRTPSMPNRAGDTRLVMTRMLPSVVVIADNPPLVAAICDRVCIRARHSTNWSWVMAKRRPGRGPPGPGKVTFSAMRTSRSELA